MLGIFLCQYNKVWCAPTVIRVHAIMWCLGVHRRAKVLLQQVIDEAGGVTAVAVSETLFYSTIRHCKCYIVKHVYHCS